MKVSRNLSFIILALVFSFFITFTVNASSLDDLSRNNNNNNATTNQQTNLNTYTNNQIDNNVATNDNAMYNYLDGYEVITNDNMQKASTLASPIVNLIGTITGFVLMIATGFVGFTTAVDLLYIGVPFTRNYLVPQAAGGGMGMGMGGMMGGGGSQPSGHCWVSDEAKAAVGTAGQPSGGGMGMGGGFGGGMGMGMGGGFGGGMGMGGGFGGSPMGGGMMGGGGQQQKTSSPIITYLKSRSIFIIFFIVCSVILTSSILTDCGLNLAQLLLKIMMKVNGNISDVHIG